MGFDRKIASFVGKRKSEFRTHVGVFVVGLVLDFQNVLTLVDRPWCWAMITMVPGCKTVGSGLGSVRSAEARVV